RDLAGAGPPAGVLFATTTGGQPRCSSGSCQPTPAARLASSSCPPACLSLGRRGFRGLVNVRFAPKATECCVAAKHRHYAVQQFDAVPTAVDADQEADLIIRRRQRIADDLASEVQIA